MKTAHHYSRFISRCFKSVWLTVALHEGLAFPPNYGHLTGAPETVQGKVRLTVTIVVKAKAQNLSLTLIMAHKPKKHLVK